MKKLSLSQPTLLLMVGVPGAGKSFFARQFADVYGLPRISADRIRFELFNDPQYSSGEQHIVHRMTDYMIDELLQSHGTFIVDGLIGNTKAQRMAIERRARQHGCRVLLIWVQVDAQTAQVRSSKRNPQKRDDQFNKPLSEAAFLNWCKQLAPPTTEQHVVVSGKHTFPAQRMVVLKKLLPLMQLAPGRQESSAANVRKSAAPDSDHSKPVASTPSHRPGPPADRRIIIS